MAIQTFQFSVVLAIGFSLAAAALNAVAIDATSTIPASMSLQDPEDVTASRGQPATFRCGFASTSRSKVEVSWSLNDVPLPHDDPRWRTFGNGTLYIPRVSGKRSNGSLEGNYRCTVKNAHGALISNPAKLQIAVVKDFTNQPEDITVVEMQPIIIPCSITSTPSSTIVWERDETPLPQNPRYVPLPTGSLLIENVHSTDSGPYRCKATNAEANKSKVSRFGKIAVMPNNPKTIVPPTILPVYIDFNVTVLVGNDVTLYCIVNGWPRPTIQWLNDINVSVGNSSVLVINNATLGSSGRYTCTAYNSEGTVTQDYYVSVQQPPFFNVTPTSKVYPASKTIRLDCQVFGVPKPRVVWYKNGEVFNIDSTFGRAHLQSTSLLISYSVASDAGFYQCFAQNPVGQVWAAALVKLSFSPKSPTTPLEIRCQSFNDTSVCLQWSSVPNAQAYSILAYHPGQRLKDYITNETFKLADKLLPNTNYTFLVRTYSNEASNEFVHVTCATGKKDRREMKIQRHTDTSVKLVWSEISTDSNPCAGDEPTYYKIQWRKVNQTSINIEHTTGLKWIVKNLTPGTSYEFRVQSSVMKDDNSDWRRYSTPALNDTTADVGNELDSPFLNQTATVPTVPSNLDAIATSSRSVNLTWSDASVGSVVYTVCYVAVRENKECQLGKVLKSYNHYLEIGNLKPKTEYEFKVRTSSKNGLQSSYSNSLQITTPSEVPTPVQGLKYKIVNSTSACVRWEPPLHRNGRLSGYLIKYTPNDSWPLEQWHSISYSLSQKNKGCWNQDLPHLISKLLVDLEPSKRYIVIVVALNEAGPGNPTVPITISTKHTSVVDEYQPPKEEKSPSTVQDIYYKQGIGVILGLGISLLLLFVCVGCFLLKKKYTAMRGNTRGRPIFSSSQPQLGSLIGAAGISGRQESCVADVHEMQQLVEGNGAVYVPTHLDTKGGAEFPNGQLNGSLRKGYLNGSVPNNHVHITENPQYPRPKSNAKLSNSPEELKHMNGNLDDENYEEDSNSNLQKTAFSKLLDGRNSQSPAQNHNGKQHFDSSLDSSVDVSLNSTQLTVLDDFISLDSFRKISPSLGPNG